MEKTSLSKSTYDLIAKALTTTDGAEAMRFSQAACNTANAAVTLSALPGFSEHQVAYMTERFLGWKLPENFNPDGGIIFSHTSGGHVNKPTGTNLLDYSQAKAMIQHMLEGLPQ